MPKQTNKGRPIKEPYFYVHKDKAEMRDVDNRHSINIFNANISLF